MSFLAPAAARHASGLSVGNKEKKKLEKLKKKRKVSKTYIREKMRETDTYSLLDAMRYLRAFEVGRNARTAKYELAVAFKTNKNSPVVRGQIKVPHPFDTSNKIAVIAPPNSDAAKAAIAAGADFVGEDDILADIKANNIGFQRLLLHPDSEEKLRRANVGRILGPKGLMPNQKTGTIVRDIAGAIGDMAGASEYRERDGIVRLAIGQLAFTPEQLEKNIKTVMTRLKQQAAVINASIMKEIHEVVSPYTTSTG